MKFTTRVAATATIGLLFSTGVLAPATADVTVAPTETTSPVPTSSATPTPTTVEPAPSDNPSSPSPTQTLETTPQPPAPLPSNSTTSEQCTVEVQQDVVIIAFPDNVDLDAISADELMITVDAESLNPASFRMSDSRIRLDREEATGVLRVELHHNDIAVECETRVPEITEEPSPPEDDDDETDDPGDGDTDEPPEPPEPTPTEPESPTATLPVPTGPSTPVPDATPEPPGELQPQPQPEQTSTAPSEAVPSPSQTQDTSSQPSASGSRTIQIHSGNPRYLLPRMLGVESQYGSPLVLPHPRNAALGEPDLETLPPISEDELNALKARTSTPDQTGRSDNEHDTSVASTGITTGSSAWILSGLVLLICLVLGAWWALSRRHREH